MHSYRHQGFRIANRNRAIGLENLHYTSKFFELASRAGEELGLEKGVNYTAVQWRSETVGLYKACADFLLNQSWSTTPEAPSHLLLVSDIAVDPKRLLWHNMKHHAVNTSDQQDALTAFFKRGFRKVDQLSAVRDLDIGVIGIIDKILSIQATRFVTCVDVKSSICNQCMRTKSYFSLEILNRRSELGLNSRRTWDHAFAA
eukprot:gnl/TRDRNA2_/TRDRNA2_177913_c5_seq24.p1 gnl/TRDRNA2_/TRDRNA2_177913_c5~~gnl/TRDRNA2_/TRDRNA2_177913_c5_seq24.p1  ORF type:complete len:201 (-),score=25.78 gnl/TRDRNA2_/TRDRNA2_177913_c5_seq24:141-743(-)